MTTTKIITTLAMLLATAVATHAEDAPLLRSLSALRTAAAASDLSGPSSLSFDLRSSASAFAFLMTWRALCMTGMRSLSANFSKSSFAPLEVNFSLAALACVRSSARSTHWRPAK